MEASSFYVKFEDLQTSKRTAIHIWNTFGIPKPETTWQLAHGLQRRKGCPNQLW